MGVRPLLVTSLLVLAAAAARADERAEARVNGESRQVWIERVDPQQDPAMDVLYVSDFTLTRGAAPELEFRTADDGRLFQRAPDGSESLVALRVDPTGEDAATSDVFLELGDVGLARLRGLDLVGWRAEYAAPLLRVDAVCCVIELRLQGARPIPGLPPGLRWLTIDAGDDSGPLDLTPLEPLTQLRRLEVGFGDGGMGIFPATAKGVIDDFGPLSGMRELRTLRTGVRPGAVGSFPLLPQLRTLHLWDDEQITDVSFVARLPRLVEFRADRTGVSDLRPLGACEDLQVLRAEGAPVERLPQSHLPQLQRVELLGNAVPSEAMTAFVARQPEAVIRHSAREELLAVASGATRMRLRYFNVLEAMDDPTWVTVFESSSTNDIATFVDLIELEERDPIGPCMCEAIEEIDLFRGEERIAQLALHHDSILRAYEGVDWPGGLSLTDASAEALLPWLAQRGMTRPQQDRRRRLERNRRTARALAAEDAVVGEETTTLLRGDPSDTDRDAALEALGPTPEESMRSVLRLYAASGDETTAIARALYQYLFNGSRDAAVVRALETLLEQPDELDTLTRALRFAGRLDDIDPGWLHDARLTTARRVLRRPTADASLAVIAVELLASAEGPAAEAELLALLPAQDAAAEAATELQVQAVHALAGFCDLRHEPRLRATLARCEDLELREMRLQRLENRLAERRPTREE